MCSWKRRRDADLSPLIQNSQPVTSNKDGTLTTTSLSLTRRVFHFPNRLLGKAREFVKSVIGGYRQQNGAFSRVKAQCTGRDVRAPEFTNAEKTDVGTRSNIVRPHVFIANVINLVSVYCESGSLTFKLKNDETAVMTLC
jgi:hypothetical protein